MFKKKGSITFVSLIVSLFAVTLACQSSIAVEMQTRQTVEAEMLSTMEAERATQLALAQTTNPSATETPEAPPTPECLLTYDYFGMEVCLQEETFSSSDQPEGTIRLVASGNTDWVWYYDAVGNQLGQLAEGLAFSYTIDDSTGEYVIQLTGWVPNSNLETLAADTARTTCQTHSHGHRSTQVICHAHFWNTSGQEIGSIPPNLDVTIIGEVTTRPVKDEHGQILQAEGVEIIIEQLVRIRPENADT